MRINWWMACCVVACTLGTGTALGLEPWRDPLVNSINRLPARAIAVPCENAERALAIAKGAERTTSKWFSLLDGTWDFQWKREPSAAWEKSGKITVPGCWQLQGDYDPALYVCAGYPIAFSKTGDPMGEPKKHYTSTRFRNPVGLYSRTFTVPAAWKGRSTTIHFGGVSSAMYVRVNGREVGYSEDSRLPAEFDLTPYLKEGDNRLEVEVYKHSDGTFYEDQDFWRLSGIFRSVWLVSEAKEASRDVIVETTLSDDRKTGRLVVRDENGATLFTKTYPNVKLWSCETPNLYHEAFEVGGGDWRAVQVGFREVKIKNSVIHLNGKRMIFRGTDRHEMMPEAGYAVTPASMKRDLELFRKFNINAVRTSHYPNDPLWYELCDREGIYVVCEANLECQGSGYNENSLSRNPLFRNTHVERGVNMIKTFRNHPSIVVWSMGNECYWGDNFIAEYKAMKRLDATRPVQYECAGNNQWTDIRCPMYMRPQGCEKYVSQSPTKPFVLCEYTHAMGNSNGGIQKYWDLVWKYPSMQGGFIWDFVDQALWKTDKRGKWLAYGGDFGDQPNSDNFNCNGIFDATRTPHPGAFEVKHAYQPIRVTAFDWTRGLAAVHNTYSFLDLTGVTGKWTADKDGAVVATGVLDLSNFAADTKRELKAAVPATADAVCFSFSRGNEIIAWDQFSRPFTPKAAGETVGAAQNRFRLNFWRAPIDNDRGWRMQKKCEVWKKATDTQKLPAGCTSDLKVSKLKEGGTLVDWTFSFPTNLCPIPRVGLTFTVPASYTNATWYGLGPWENYSDRATGALLGVHSASVGLVTGLADAKIGTIDYPCFRLNPDNYAEPGEQGYRTGCRWLELSDGAKKGLRVTALNRPFGFNAWPYSQAKLEKAKHQFDLTKDGEITVNIDAVQIGVGGDDSWGSMPHDEFCPKAGTYRLVFVLNE